VTTRDVWQPAPRAASTVLITGGSSGLGQRVAAELAADPGWHVVVTGRDPQRTSAAATAAGAEPQLLDLGSLDDVRRFAAGLRGGERPPLRALICNAGVQHVSPPEPVLSRDGYEETFAVNHLGHFLLVALLLDQFLPPARVVVVSSGTHDPAQSTGVPSPRYTSAAELARSDAGWAAGDSPGTAGRRRYSTSKLCNLLFTYEAERRWGSHGITFNAFDPGLMPGTGLARDYPGYQRLAWRFLMPVLTVASSKINTPRQSARALARLVTDPALQDVSGRYWLGTNEGASSTDSHDLGKAADLWQTSLELAGLDAGEPQT
jgi:light-dependent protochlorophyllide reductase